MVPYIKGQFRFGVMNITYENMWKPMFTKTTWHFTECAYTLLFSYISYDRSSSHADHRHINEDTETRGCLDFIKRKQ